MAVDKENTMPSFGFVDSVQTDEFDWRAAGDAGEDERDDGPADDYVIMMLGFDPDELDEEEAEEKSVKHPGHPDQSVHDPTGGHSSSDASSNENALTSYTKSVSSSYFEAAMKTGVPAKHGASVTKYTAAEYEKMGAKCFLSAGKKSGFAIKSDGELISVFSSEGKGKHCVEDAIKKGAKKLDCYSSLVNDFYKPFGFKETGRDKWNDKYAPPNWNYKDDNHPDVVYMAR